MRLANKKILLGVSGSIAAYKARALAALRADSSLSVRLARYQSAMSKARALEAAGGAQ